MKIIADGNIPRVEDVFGGLGAVRTLPGRDICRDVLLDADVLLVRSVTPVGEELLSGSRVRFVGTATIGTDHVDTDYLEDEGIRFASAPGSNANSVAEYITAALLTLAQGRRKPLKGSSIGVIGAGNVGDRVVRKAAALGMEVVKNDPPLARCSGDQSFRPLEEALECDYVTLHVPLEEGGPDPTYRMVDEGFLEMMGRDAQLLNSSRGAVVEESALKRALKEGLIGGAVLDVWENEPAIDPRTLGLADIATPHIAGYSLDGKYNGVKMLYHALCDYSGAEPHVNVDAFKPAPEIRRIVIDDPSDLHGCVRRAVEKVYDIREDDSRLRRMLTLPAPQRAEYFDALRKNYPARREFFNAAVEPGDGADRDRWREAARVLGGLGFAVDA